jgi:outer membrane protein TolC
VVLHQSLYDGGTSQAKLEAANAQRDKLRAQKDALSQEITMQVTNAILNMQTAEKKVQSAAQANAMAEEAFRAAETSYINQVVPMIDVLSAQTTLTNTRMQLALAEFDRQTALIQYRLALGKTPVSVMTLQDNQQMHEATH